MLTHTPTCDISGIRSMCYPALGSNRSCKWCSQTRYLRVPQHLGSQPREAVAASSLGLDSRQRGTVEACSSRCESAFS